jgi:hypothetical protein
MRLCVFAFSNSCEIGRGSWIVGYMVGGARRGHRTMQEYEDGVPGLQNTQVLAQGGDRLDDRL